MNYYNEFDPKAAAWLRELIRAGEIPAGDVDERSIAEVQAHEIASYTQHHFFAGIGGWSLALRLAGWPEDRPVTTASLPCQPFSASGKQEGASDDRHLWPIFFSLAKKCGFERMFGEQVAQAIGFNWLDGISADLEEAGYAVGSVVLGAHSLGAPHRRQRLYWVADSDGMRRSQCGECHGDSPRPGIEASRGGNAGRCGVDGRMADAPGLRGAEQLNGPRGRARGTSAAGDTSECAGPCGLADAEYGNGRRKQQSQQPAKDGRAGPSGGGSTCGLGDTPGEGCEGPQPELQQSRQAKGRLPSGPSDSRRLAHSSLPARERLAIQHEQLSGPTTFWDRFDIIPCRDGKARRIESGVQSMAHGIPSDVDEGWRQSDGSIFPLAKGIQGRVGLLRGAGNAIVPQVAATFIQACQEALTDL